MQSTNESGSFSLLDVATRACFLFLPLFSGAASETRADDDIRGFTISMGSLQSAYSALNSTVAREELRLSALEKRAASRRTLDYFDSPSFRTNSRKIVDMRSVPWNVDTYFRDVLGDVLNNKKNVIRVANDSIMNDVHVLLGDDRYARFRQLFTQELMRSDVFDSVITLNGLKFTPKQYAELHSLAAKMRKDRPRKDTAEWTGKSRYRAALKRVVSPRVDAETLSQVTGDEVESVFHLEATDTLFDEEHYGLKIGLARLVTNPLVQQNVGMTIQQSVDANKLLKKLKEKSRQTHKELDAMQSTSAARSRSPQIISSFNGAAAKDVERLLKPDQMSAFKRVACQYLLANGNLNETLRLLGASEELKNEHEEWCLVCAEAYYTIVMEEIRFGIELLTEVLDEQRVKRLCGTIVLPGSAWSVSGEEEYLKKERSLRKQIAKSLADLNRKRSNPRRAVRERPTQQPEK